jgi:hypothetical protein
LITKASAAEGILAKLMGFCNLLLILSKRLSDFFSAICFADARLQRNYVLLAIFTGVNQ